MSKDSNPKFKFTRNIFLLTSFAATVLLLITMELMDFRQEINMVESTALVAQTQDMESELNRLLALVQDLESGARGYILTEKPAFLVSYETTQHQIADQQRNLLDLIRDPEQRDMTITLGSLITRLTDISRRYIEMRHAYGLEVAIQAVSSEESKAVMDQIQALYTLMLDRHKLLLKKRSEEVTRQITLARMIKIMGTILSISLLGIIFILLIRENKLRQQSLLALAEREQEAKRTNLAKTEFLSHMSHELRTPLNSILGFAQLIQQQQANLTEDQKNAVLLVIQSGLHLRQLINEALDITHIESGKIILHLESVPVGAIIEECLSLLRSGARMQDIKLDVIGSIDWMIVADHFRFKQVLINLISNAIKYNRPGGSVTVECSPTNDHLRLSIIDTGIGIPADKVAEVFTPFSRFAMEKCEGTGIGLTISKLLVEAMGGQIGFSSEPGVGCTFWIEFRRERRSTQRDLENYHIPSNRFRPKINPTWATITGKILYVEDTSANVQLLRMVLKRYLPGITILDAGTAEQGIDLAKSERPDLILMDINLPGMSGIEAFKILQNEPATSAIPVIALSATAMQRDIDRAMEVGFNSYITKPIDIQVIPGIIAKYMPVIS